MLENQLNLYETGVEAILEKSKEYPNASYDYKKHQIVFENDLGHTTGYIRLPLHYVLTEDLILFSESARVLYVTMESGSASVCLTVGEKIRYHKTFSAYMTRKKQGVSQIKYLNKKGKSRAGSRVRLAATLEFFESINTVLNNIYKEYPIVDRVAIDCSPSIMPYFYESKVKPPFDKKNERLYKIPLHLPKSNYTNLNAAIKKLKAPVLFYEDGFEW